MSAAATHRRRQLPLLREESARVLSILPRAAAMYRKETEQGLNGDARVVLKARLFLR